ncbi:MAG: reprolysin-like metallopeptidase, partial [Bacteroidota bacterium]
MKRLLPIILLFSGMFASMAQQRPAWVPVPAGAGILPNKAAQRSGFPAEFKLFQLDLAPLRQAMMSVAGNNRSALRTVISLPTAAGKFEDFEIIESSNFHPDLQARFPNIRAYSGRSLTNPGSTLKISIDDRGIQGMVFRAGDVTEYLEPYSEDNRVYAAFRRQRPAGGAPWTCSTADQALANGLQNRVSTMATTIGAGNVLRTMRLAQSCNAEYSNYFGAFSSADVAKVLAAFNATLTRCNGVYEKDLALHLNLIPTTDKVIYYVPSSDPYSTTISSWNNALQTTLTNNIGEANYDIGHMFGASGGGGNAGCIGCVCVDGSKGKGITSPADGIPQGDNFDIDYVAHEVGHQLGGNHTFSHSNEGTGRNKEVGSGITVMGYAGITSQDVANHSIDIFHETSIEQILTNLNGKTCPVTTITPNVAPIVSTPGNFTIPISTPFTLTGTATDAAGQVLSYCWEQNDNASSTQTGTSSVASATKATGPNWVSFPATPTGSRTFPRLSTILAGSNITGPLTGGDVGANTEALSSVSRTLNFRLTVRDNALYNSVTPDVGQTAYTDAVVTVTNTAGPFSVTAPNTAVSWENGSTQTITWSVNNTNLSPVNCTSVNILLSTDGGQSFTTLLANTPNDGSQAVAISTSGGVPNTACRIKVEAADNIFFDISNTNFIISAPAACGLPASLQSSGIGLTSATVSWAAVTGATSYNVGYKAASATTWTNLPAQAGT